MKNCDAMFVVDDPDAVPLVVSDVPCRVEDDGVVIAVAFEQTVFVVRE